MQTFLISFFFYFILFFLGASLGSFSLVVVSRRINKENWISGRSKCDNCGHTLSWQELIPIFSFIFLRGKCKNCGKKIGLENLVTEVIFGGFMLILWKVYAGNFLQYFLMVAFFVLSAMAVIEDIKIQEISDAYVLPGFIIGLIAAVVGTKDFYLKTFLQQLAFNLLAWPGLLALIILLTKLIIHKEGMGWGDVLLALMFTVILNREQLIFAVLLAFITGAIFAVFLQVGLKKAKDTPFAFGPFITLGAYISLIYGTQFVTWWLKVNHLT
jgi:prepilin signal peptidase PulO-like enzyme (type II secretory pathway)